MPPLLSLGAGLSELGKNVAQTAQAWTLESQKADLEREKLAMADKLMSARESASNAEKHNYGMIQQAARIEAEKGERDERIAASRSGRDLALRKEGRDVATGTAVSEALSGGGGADYQRKFIESVRDYADDVSKKTGVDPRIVIAQAALESDWGRKAPGNNYFGVKGTAGSPDSQTMDTKEAGPGGELYDTKAAFRKYASPAESFAHYADVINSNARYEPVRKGKDLDEQISAIGKSGYATDPRYGEKVGQIAKSLDTLSQTAEDRATIALARGGASEAKDALALRERRRESEASLAERRKEHEATLDQNVKAAAKLQIGDEGAGYVINPVTKAVEPLMIDGKPLKFRDPDEAKRQTELIRTYAEIIKSAERSYMPEILSTEATVRKLMADPMASVDKEKLRELSDAKIKIKLLRERYDDERAEPLARLKQLGAQLTGKSPLMSSGTGAPGTPPLSELIKIPGLSAPEPSVRFGGPK